eukprot:jgi/Psemu1/51956/gm1.51956_g
MIEAVGGKVQTTGKSFPDRDTELKIVAAAERRLQGGDGSGNHCDEQEADAEPWNNALHQTALHQTALHCTTLHFGSGSHPVLHCTALHCTTRRRDEMKRDETR